MSMGLLVLSVVAFALVCAPGSLVVRLALPALDALARSLSPAQRARLWLGAAWFPLVLAGLALLVALLPGWLGHDHCLVHDSHHPHLCPRHAHLSGWALLGVAAAVATRALSTGCVVFRQLLGSARTGRTLALAAERRGDLLVHDGQAARAFVLGALRPRVHVSRTLFGLDPRHVAAVLAHERSHARRHDLGFRALTSLLSCAHLPGVGGALGRRLAMAQETRADEDAARAVGDRTCVAEALIALARAQVRHPLRVAPMAHGDVEPRVRSLLASPISPRSGVLPTLVAVCLGLGTCLALEHHHVHHALETLIGSLAYF